MPRARKRSPDPREQLSDPDDWALKLGPDKRVLAAHGPIPASLTDSHPEVARLLTLWDSLEGIVPTDYQWAYSRWGKPHPHRAGRTRRSK